MVLAELRVKGSDMVDRWAEMIRGIETALM